MHQGGSNWTSLIVSIRKPDKDLRICEHCKIKVNQYIHSDSFSLQNIETVNNDLARMQYFAKIEIESAYNQIEIDKNF